MQTIIFRVDKQQGPTVTIMETIMEKNMKKNVYICITELLCCTVEINTTL